MKNKNSKENRSQKSIKKRVLTGFLIFSLIGFVIVAITTFSYILAAPSIEEDLLKDPQSSIIYDMNEQEIKAVSKGENRITVPFEDIPEIVQNAFIAVEDIRFREHIGIDIKRIFGAIYANVTEGFGAEGASTITQQVIKNSFLSYEKSIKRKVQEQYLALKLEQSYSKNEILAMYLNKIYFSEGAYGVATAAQTYFGKTLDQLELHEVALLAGIPQRPSKYNAFLNPTEAEKRRNIVLTLMAKHQFISKEEAEKAKKIPVQSSLVKETVEQAQYHQFIRQVINEIDAYAKKHHLSINVYEDGLKIYTTLDQQAQQQVDSLVESGEITFPDNKFQAAVVLLDTNSSAIRALSTGRKQTPIDFANEKRTPGSTIKPILDYGPAIEYMKWSTATLIKDEPYQYSSGQHVRNWNRKYRGNVTMREALKDSLNVPAIKTYKKVGPKNAKTFASKLNIKLNEQNNESYAIGTMGVTPLQLAGAYAAFGNAGKYTTPFTVRKIQFPDGTTIYLQPESKKAMSAATAYMMTDMLKSVVTSGTGTIANVHGLPLAAKTGSTNLPNEWNISNGVRDSWIAGYTTNYTAAVWTGYNKTTKEQYIKGNDSKISLKIFKKLMQSLHENIETSNFVMPKEVVKVYVEKETTLLPSEYTPKNKIIGALFLKGTEPTKVSNRYQRVEPATLYGEYVKERDTIDLYWNHNRIEDENIDNDVLFDLYVAIDDGPYEILLTDSSNISYVFHEPIKGATYRFKIIAKDKEYRSNQSEETTIELKIKKSILDLPGPFDSNDDEEEEQDEQNNDEDSGILGIL